MSTEQQTVLGLKRESKLKCEPCGIKFKNMRNAYDHLKEKHKGTAKGVFKEEKLSLIHI